MRMLRSKHRSEMAEARPDDTDKSYNLEWFNLDFPQRNCFNAHRSTNPNVKSSSGIIFSRFMISPFGISLRIALSFTLFSNCTSSDKNWKMKFTFGEISSVATCWWKILKRSWRDDRNDSFSCDDWSLSPVPASLPEPTDCCSMPVLRIFVIGLRSSSSSRGRFRLVSDVSMVDRIA